MRRTCAAFYLPEALASKEALALCRATLWGPPKLSEEEMLREVEVAPVWTWWRASGEREWVGGEGPEQQGTYAHVLILFIKPLTYAHTHIHTHTHTQV